MSWLKPRPTKISSNGNSCPVPLRGTGRYKFTNQIKGQKQESRRDAGATNVNGARLNGKSRRPLQSHKTNSRAKATEPAGRRRYHSQRQTNSDHCPVPLRGTGRYKFTNQIQGQKTGAPAGRRRYRRQRRPPKGGRYNVNTCVCNRYGELLYF